ncbi:MAG TPA: F0F1 ATP synthase subunit A [Vicinamibacteria bacterium]|nr:F0F1 ATP synthase subunit A [Vicinamibacteria bacterium]
MILPILALLIDEPEAPKGVADHLMEHVSDAHAPGIPHVGLHGAHLEPTQHWIFFVLAASVVLILVRWAIASYRKGGVPTGPAALVEGLVLFIRDDIAEKNIGHDGRKYTPLLCSFFFFILVAALLGLVPKFKTATGNLSVTLGLAAISFVAMQYAGISRNGLVGHFAGIVPPGLPKWLLPIMIPIEILGMFTKPFALMIRLFANMLAGHMVITTLIVLIPLMFGIKAAFGVGMIPISLTLALFIMILEVLVAFIQAYIFTLLTAIFIGMYAHPAH